jgi:hypothetical protein
MEVKSRRKVREYHFGIKPTAIRITDLLPTHSLRRKDQQTNAPEPSQAAGRPILGK